MQAGHADFEMLISRFGTYPISLLVDPAHSDRLTMKLSTKMLDQVQRVLAVGRKENNVLTGEAAGDEESDGRPDVLESNLHWTTLIADAD